MHKHAVRYTSTILSPTVTHFGDLAATARIATLPGDGINYRDGPVGVVTESRVTNDA